MALNNTGLVVRYYIDEAASGTAPTDVLDGSGVGTAFNLAIDYGSGNLAYTEISGQRGLESTATTGTQRARKTLVTGDKVITACHGKSKFVFEVVVRGDAFSASTSRIFMIANRTGGQTIGLAAHATGDSWHYHWVGAGSSDSGAAIARSANRDVIQLVFDSTQATQNDRVRYKLNGGTLTQVANVISLNDTVTVNDTLDLIMFNRESSGTWERSFDGVLFYAALYADTLPSDAQLTDNATELAADDDTPVPAALTPDFSTYPIEKLRVPWLQQKVRS